MTNRGLVDERESTAVHKTAEWHQIIGSDPVWLNDARRLSAGEKLIIPAKTTIRIQKYVERTTRKMKGKTRLPNPNVASKAEGRALEFVIAGGSVAQGLKVDPSSNVRMVCIVSNVQGPRGQLCQLGFNAKANVFVRHYTTISGAE